MKCIALATRFPDDTMRWYFPGAMLDPQRLFAKNAVSQIERHIIELCAHLNYGDPKIIELKGYYIHALQLSDGCCVIACDSPLEENQIAWLYMNLMIKRIDRQMVGDNLEAYTVDKDVADLQEKVQEILAIMKGNIEKMAIRKTHLDQLSTASNELSDAADEFHESAARLNEFDCRDYFTQHITKAIFLVNITVQTGLIA